MLSTPGKTLAKLQYSTQHALQQLNEDSTRHLITQSKDCSKAKFFTLQVRTVLVSVSNLLESMSSIPFLEMILKFKI